MPALPTADAITGTTLTTEQARAGFTQQRDFLAGVLGTAGTPLASRQALGVLFNSHVGVSSAYTVTTANQGDLISVTSGTFTISLPAAATAGSGFHVGINNGGTGTVTIDPSASELIDGASTKPLLSGESAVLYCTGTGWLALLISAPPQANNTDITANRLMRVGAFGLGISDSTLPSVANLDTLRVGGLWSYSGATGAPTGGTAGVMLHVSRSPASVLAASHVQVAFSTGARIFLRVYNQGWGDWSRIFDHLNIVGPVSQSGGNPGGAIIETGYNGNGRYTRFADGTQMCWRDAFSTSGTAEATWTYAAAFSATPSVQANRVGGTATNYGVRSVVRGNSSCDFSIFNEAGARIAGSLDLFAVGRWF